MTGQARKHLLCLTVDTDPDGLSGKVTNRQTLKWAGLESVQSLPEELSGLAELWTSADDVVRSGGRSTGKHSRERRLSA